MSEAVSRYENLARAFQARVDAVPAAAWDNQSPCTEWKARDVVGHIVAGQRRLLAGGGEAQPMGADEDPAVAFDQSLTATLAMLSNPEVLSKTVPSPFGPMPLEDLVGRLLTTDILVHTWDLARATGLDERLDADAVHHAFEGLRPMDAMIRAPGVFDAKVDPPPGANEQTQFLCFLGRAV